MQGCQGQEGRDDRGTGVYKVGLDRIITLDPEARRGIRSVDTFLV